MAPLRRRTTAVLVVGQILGGFGVAIGVALAALLAAEVSGSAGAAGLAVTASVTGTAVLSLPLAALMARHGRRPGLTCGYLIGAVGGLIVVVSATRGWFVPLLAGMLLFGAGSSANLQARFAAADLAPAARRGRAIATVMWAGTLGAVLGPNLAGPAGRSIGAIDGRIPETAGPFVWASGIFLLAAATTHLLLRPDPLLTARSLDAGETAGAGTEPGVPPRTGKSTPVTGERALRRGWDAVISSPTARTALAGVAVVHTAMITIMVMTPVDLAHHGAGIELIGLVISGHIAGMYAFSPVMGRLADRWGGLPLLMGSLGTVAVAAALAGTADGRHTQSAVALFLLGLGWSAGLVAGSALVTDAVPIHTRPAAQGLSDLTMNGCAALGGAVAGPIVSSAGYGTLNAVAAALLLPVAVLALRAAVRRTA
ncbi:MFS transporter [Streptomyces calidiresistens]|nr:MFS transporter [Streptomyces calidiresistens]